MTQIPRPLDYEVLVGCTWVAALPEHVRKGDVFRMVKRDGSPYKAASRALPHVGDAGVYIASEHGGENGVPFHVTPPVVELVAPVVDLGD